MKLKAVSALFLITLLISMSTLAFNLQTVMADREPNDNFEHAKLITPSVYETMGLLSVFAIYISGDSLSFVDAQGYIVETNQTFQTNGLFGFSTELPAGNYTIEVTYENETKTKRAEILEGQATYLEFYFGEYMLPRKPHDVAITDVQLSDNVVIQSHSVSINVTATNQGTFIETFNVTAYYNETNFIGTQNVTLASGDSTTITFSWNTTGIPSGNYTISAMATPVPDETETTDNTYTDCWLLVVIVGDVDGDGVVNVLDIILVLINTGPVPPSLPECDVNDDGVVNVLDLIIVLINVG